MGDLSFDVELSWSATGGRGSRTLQTNDVTLEISGRDQWVAMVSARALRISW